MKTSFSDSCRFLISVSFAYYFALFSTPADAVSSILSSWRQPSLIKRPLHEMGFGSREIDSEIASNTMITSSPTKNAVLCVRGGDGSNGPCIGIDLGETILRFWLAFL
jgi:hypothetical protein